MIEQRVQEQVITRAVKDVPFRERLLANPMAVLAREYHVHLPENVAVRVIEEAPNTLSIVLPPQEEMLQELSDEDLAAAAGGDILILTTRICPSLLGTFCDRSSDEP
jgi:hypothetical protein